MENIDLEESLDYYAYQAKLQRFVVALESQDQKIEQLNRDWKKIESDLFQYPGDEDKKVEIVAAVTSALERVDTRVVEECIAQLEGLMNLGVPLKDNPFSLPSGGDERNAFKQYIGIAGKLDGLLERQSLKGLQNTVKSGKAWGGLKFGRFPRPLHDEVLKAIDSWRWLKQGSAKAHNNIDHICTVLRYLGFNVDAEAIPGANSQQRGEHWLYLRIEMTTGGRAPIPQFGSQQKNYFDIVCLWSGPVLTRWLVDEGSILGK